MGRLAIDLAATVLLALPVVLFLRPAPARDGWFWLLIALATAGPIGAVGLPQAEAIGSGTPAHWNADLPAALWLSIATTMIVFTAQAAVLREGWRVFPVLAAYLVPLGALATLWRSLPERGMAGGWGATPWIPIHVAASLATYALVSVAAAAAVAGLLTDAGIRRRWRGRWLRALPSVADSDDLAFRLLALGQIVLGVGVASGLAIQYTLSGSLLALNHKTVLTLAAFGVVGLLLVAYRLGGVGGRRGASLILLGQVLLTLGYLGVKVVREVLLA